MSRQHSIQAWLLLAHVSQIYSKIHEQKALQKDLKNMQFDQKRNISGCRQGEFGC